MRRMVLKTTLREVENMSEQLNNQKGIISKFAEGPERLEQAITGLSDADLDASLSEDSWTIRHIVHHLADGDELWRLFIRQAMGDPGGGFALEWYWQMPQEEWSRRWAYRERTLGPSLSLYNAGRRCVVQLLEAKPDAWEQTLLIRWSNGEEQEVSVGWVVEMQTRHLEGHLKEIQKIKEACLERGDSP